MSFSATISSSLDVDMMAVSGYRRCDVKKERKLMSRPESNSRLKSSQGKVCPVRPLNMAGWVDVLLQQGLLF